MATAPTPQPQPQIDYVAAACLVLNQYKDNRPVDWTEAAKNLGPNVDAGHLTSAIQKVEFLRTKHVHIALPCYAGQLFECVLMSMLKFCISATKIGMNFSVDTMINESLITRGRNGLVAKFMNNTASTHLMWIDSDIGFEPEDIYKLLLHDKDVIGGLYPKKTIPIDYVVNVNPETIAADGKIATQNGLIPVSRMGTGFMLVKRQVFERMFLAYPETHYKNNIGLDPVLDQFMFALYDCSISKDTHEYLSEDWTFCDRARALGIELFVDSTVRLDHSGFFRYPGKPETYHRMFNVAPADDGSVAVNFTPRIAARQDVIQTEHAPKPKVLPDLPTILTPLTPENIVKKPKE